MRWPFDSRSVAGLAQGRLSRLFDVSSAWRAAGWYGVLTVVMTWPLAPNMARDIPGDLGDPLLVCYLIARAAEHWLALLSGDFGAAIRFWHAGFFHPEPFVTVYSEHFAAHALLILPAWVLTKNIILCYNMLFFASFVVGGTGIYLLTRELTGSARGAFVAALMFMFTPYRFVTMAHLQVLSTQWMPLALYGLRRYFATGRRLPLWGSACAVLLQNLSSGYYLIYFAPLASLYAIAEMWARHMLARWRVWRDLAIAAVAIVAATLPFSLPYAMMQRRLGYRRPLDEIATYSADLLSWLTATPAMNVWGWLQALPRPEGLLFPGLVIVAFAIVGVIGGPLRGNAFEGGSRNGSTRAVVLFAVVGCLFSVWMAMGPRPTFAGRPLPIPSLYLLFYNYVPGFDVSRVASRFNTLVVLCLAVLAAYGLTRFDRPGRRWLLALAAVGVLLDGAALPLERNLVFRTSTNVNPPADRVFDERNAPTVWRHLKGLPADAVLAHLPFGYAEHELRYLYYSRVDGHRLSNGYSGAFPLSYQQRAAILQRAADDPAAAAARLREDGVSHVVVHTDLYRGDAGTRTLAALEAAGLRRVTRVGAVYVIEVPR